MSAFRKASQILRDNGYSVVPLTPVPDLNTTDRQRNKRKSPWMHEWSKYCVEPADEKTYRQWMKRPDDGIGLCLGPASGVMALDFDDDVNGLHDRILAMVPESPVKKMGRKGFTAFYRYGGEKSVNLKVHTPTGSITVLDVLSEGRHTVMPPTRHPMGMEYRWLTEKTLENTLPHELPELGQALVDRFTKLFPSEQRTVRYHAPQPLAFDTPDEITEAISYIPPDLSYHEWIAIGMALNHRLDMAGFEIWDSWSASGSKYGGRRETYYHWCTFKGEGITIATLFDKAAQYGFKNKGYQQPIYPQVDITPGGNLDLSPAEEKALLPDSSQIPEAMFYPQFDQTVVDEVLNTPGLPGLVANFIGETALYPLPMLSLGAALAFSGMVMANRVVSPTGLRSNIYALGVAESGSGKDWPRQVCKHLMARFGFEKQSMGEPISGAGLLTSLVNADNRGLVLIDEFGMFMQAMAGRAASPHKREIAKYMMELYTSAGQVFLGPEYANKDGTNPRVTIANPCLSMFPVTTPSTFYDNVSGREVIDGFMARFLVFESDRYPIKAQAIRRSKDDVPDKITRLIEHWKGVDTVFDNPIKIAFTPEAEALFTDYSIRMRMKAAKGGENNFSSIYSRITENALRIALVAHEDGEVGIRVAKWAIKTAEFCSGMLTKAVQDTIGDNEYERMFKKLLKVIGALQDDVRYPLGVPHSILIGRTRFMDTKMRNEMLESAMHSGDVLGQPDPAREPGTKGSNPLFYKLKRTS